VPHITVTRRGLWEIPHSVAAPPTASIHHVTNELYPNRDEESIALTLLAQYTNRSFHINVLLATQCVYVFRMITVIPTVFTKSVTHS
jgi:hypothetical protein